MGKLAFKKSYVIILAVVGVALMVIPNFFIGEKDSESKEKETVTVSYYTEKIEKKLEELLSGAKGVGEVKVVVTLDRSGEYVYARNEAESEGRVAADYVIVNGKDGEEAVFVSEIYPKIRGVAVVCTGGGDAKVKKRVTELVSAALGISTGKIAVSG